MLTIVDIITEGVVEYILGGCKRRRLQAMIRRVINTAMEIGARKILSRLLRI